MRNFTKALRVTRSKLSIGGVLALFLLLLTVQSSWGQAYKEDFGNSATVAVPYTSGTNATGSVVKNTNFTAPVWSQSLATANLAGNTLGALSATITAAGTYTATCTFTVTSGFQFNPTSIGFDNRTSSTGPNALTITISGTGGSTTVSPTPSRSGAFTTTTATNFASTSQNLTGVVTLTFAFTGGTTGATIRLDNVILNGTVSATGPSISGAATATAFTTTYGTASAVQTFAVSGSSLTANLVATAPTGFEVSSDGTTYGSTATFTQTSGSASGSLRIRLAANAAVTGSYNSQTIPLTSTGATTVNITTAASGNVVTAKGLTITGLTGVNRAYNGLTGATSSGTAAYSGLANSESFTVTGTPSLSFATAAVGTAKTITVSGYTAPSTNYTLTQPSLSANITAAPLTITGLTGVNKNYDGNTSASISGTAAYSGLQNGETFTVTGTPSFAFATATVGTAKTITVSGYTAPSSNYSISQPSLSANILDVAPGAPTIGTASAGNGQADVTFTAPAFNGGSAITSYTVTSTPDSITASGASSPITITGLTNGTAYTFTVTATNAAALTSSASGATSPSVTPTSGATAPGAPTAVSATRGNAQASVSFSAPASDGGDAITSYTVTSSPGGFTASGASSPLTVTGLTNGTGYTFTVTATNSIGTGFASSPSSSVTPATTPSAPSIASILGENGGLLVDFTAGSTGGTAITDYKYSVNGGSFVSAATTTTPIEILGLTNGTSYNIQILAVNAVGDGTASGTTAGTPGVVPGVPTITSITPANVQLSVVFTAPSSDGGHAITSYQYSTDGGAHFVTRATGTTASPIVITTQSTTGTPALVNGTTYQVQIKAVNDLGAGTATASTSGTPATTPGAPTGISITPGNGNLSVAFTAPASTGGSAITSYKYSTNGGTNFITRQTGTTASPLVITTSSVDGTTALSNGVSYSVQIKAVNAMGDGTATSTTSGTPGLTYCASTGPASQGSDYLTNFTASGSAGGINNTSTYSTNGYGDFTAQSVSQGIGGTVNFSAVSPGIGNGSTFAIFVDWNQDGDFLDTNEAIVSLGAGTQITTNPSSSFTVPAGATLGSTRMRVIIKDATGAAVSCNTALPASETEDYTFTVVTLSTPPTLTATTPSTSVDGSFTVTFPTDATYTSAISTGNIAIGVVTLTPTTDYTVSGNTITFTPSVSGNSSLRTPGAYTISVNATGYSPATVSQTMTVGAPANLALTTQPTAPALSGAVLAAQPVVTVKDKYSNAVGAGINVNAAVTSGQGSNWTLGGTATVATNASGIATFSGLTATNQGLTAFTTATITFTPASGTGSVTSTPVFTVPAPANKLVITSISPANPTVGASFSVTVQSQNNAGTATGVLTTTGITLTNTGGGTLGGTATGSISASGTSVTISGLTLSSVASGVTVTATQTSGSPTLTAATSSTFNVLAAADHLAFGTSPAANGSLGSNLTSFTVQALRPDGTLDNTYTGNVTVAKVSGPGNLTGTLTVAASAGVAAFSAVQMDAVGTYTINASSGALTVTSTSGNIVIGLANATAVLWSSAAGSAYLTTTNWTSSAVPTASQVGQFGVNPTPGTNANINGGTTSVGAIEATSARSINITIGNNSGSATSGTFTLNGVVVNSIANVIIRNNSSGTITIQNTGSSGSGSNTMGVALANATDNVINIDGTGGVTISSIISGTSKSLTKAGSNATGILTLSGANTYSGGTTISTGTLQLGAAGVLADAGTITLGGGTLSTGASAGFAETVGTLNLSASSTIALGTGVHTLTFANSSAVSWAGSVLTVTGWTGTAGASGTAGKIVVGAGGLTQGQLDKIQFSGYSIGAKLVSGEVVPKAIPTVTPTIGTYAYTGSAQGPNSVTTASTGAVTYSYVGVSGTTYGPSATAPTNVGSYTVTATVAADANYYGASSSATAFTIGKGSSTVTVTGTTSFTYDGSAQGPSTSDVTGSAGAVTYSYVGVSGTSYTASATAPTGAGSYTVTATVASDSNYNGASSSATGFSIGKASSSVTVTGTTSFTYSGAGQGPNTSDVTGSTGVVTYSYVGVSGTSYSASGVMPTNAGSYTVTATVAADANYNTASSSAVGFTIDKATPTITATPIGTYTYSGLAQGPSAATTGGSTGTVTYSYVGVSGTSYTASSTKPTLAGSYTVTASAAADANYNSASSSGAGFTIDKATVTVTAVDKTKVYGNSNPTFTASYSGFVNGEVLGTSDVTGAPSLTTTATASSTVGDYTITSAVGTLSSSNYQFSYTDGTLTIGTKALTITADNQSKCFGSSLSLGTTAFTTSAMVSGDSVSSVTLTSTGSGSGAAVGSYAIVGTSASGTGLSNYAISYTDGSLTVNPLPTATIGGTLSMCQNGASPVVTFTGANGTAPYTFSYNINGGSTLTVSTTSGNSVTVTVPTSTAGSFAYNLVSVQDSSSTACSQSQSGTATVTFNTSSIYYADADGDGYGNLAVTSAPLCAAPSGYVANSADCDDTNAAVNPGHVEVAGDGIDNNCDGRIDEAGPKTGILFYQCGITLSSLYSPIAITPVASAVKYRYEVSYGSTPTVVTYETTATSIKLSDVVVPIYGTAYSIRVSVKMTQSNGDFWQVYGTSCTVTTPAAPTTQLASSSCGISTPSLYTSLTANPITLATGYKFEVSTGGSVVGTYSSSSNVFNLSQVAGTVYSTVYSIRVAIQYAGSWQAYGSACTVTTTVPATQLVSTICGMTLASVTSPLTAMAVPGVTSYRFEVSTGGSVVGTYDSASNVFNLTQIAGTLYSTSYSIRVTTIYNGTVQSYGSACTVTTPAIGTTQLVSLCGTTLASSSTPLTSGTIALATGYRFEATNGGTTRTYDSATNVFNLNQLSGGAAPSTTYTVRVAPIYNGSAQAYGSTCSVTTPSLGVTRLVSSQCGITITSVYASLYANPVTLATGYRFEATNGGTTRTYDAASNVFNLMQLSGGATYATTYTIRVAAIFSGVAQSYGSSCNVTTPAVPTTQLVSPACGSTIASRYTLLTANPVTLATGYRFEVTNGGTTRTYDSATNVFNLMQLAGGATYSTTYSIRVAPMFSGVASGYGSTCSVTTAAAPRRGEIDATLVFTAKGYPNPFSAYFNLSIESSSDDAVEVKVYDMVGRELEVRKATVSELSTQELGNNYPQGVYNVIVTQGDQVKTLRMIKR